MGIFPKKVFTFYAGLLGQHSLEVSPGCMSSASSNLSLIKWREAYWCYFSVLVFLLPLSPEKFSANTRRAEHSI